MSAFDDKLATRLDARKAEQLYRTRRVQASPQQPDVISDGKRLLAFCSNDYLGLANHPELIAAFKRGLDTYGAGSGASHLVAGHSHAHHALEEELAAFTGRSRALVFSSGFMANVGVLAALAGTGDQVFEDRLNHASLLDGGLNSGATFKRYPHLDTARLGAMLAGADTPAQRFIVSDGVFSMDGDVAPLGELLALAQQHEAVVMLDDAHGFGCLGSTGGGLVEAEREKGVDTGQEKLAVLVGTFGKAFGTAGAFVAGSEALVETLIQFCRPYIYTTAMPPALAEATRCSLRLVQQDGWRRAHLRDLIARFRGGCAELGLSLTDSQTPIQGLLLGAAGTALEWSSRLEQQGILVSAIRPPTVPPGSARLRISFSAAHTPEHVTRLLDALERIAPTLPRQSGVPA
ncbi:MAG TPA: 8-amino-7-oxononanoate synthase [Pseudomonadales bacterium]